MIKRGLLNDGTLLLGIAQSFSEYAADCRDLAAVLKINLAV